MYLRIMFKKSEIKTNLVLNIKSEIENTKKGINLKDIMVQLQRLTIINKLSLSKVQLFGLV